MKTQHIAIVILNWNGKLLLEKFLSNVLENSSGIATVIVGDNGSTDDSIAFLEKNHPDVTLIRLSSNLGFAAGYNEVLKQVTADYYVLLNSDVKVTKNWLGPPIELLESDPMISACQPKIRSYHKPDEFEYAGASGAFIDYLGYPFCRGRVFQRLEKDIGQYDDVRPVFWASGACMFVRANVFHELGGFDSHFFAHMEEIDLCWRMQKSGYKIYVCPRSTVYHVGGGTLANNSPYKTYLNFRNNLLMIYKNTRGENFFGILFIRTIMDLAAAIKFLFTNNWRHCTAVFKAHMHFYSMRKNYSDQKNTATKLLKNKSLKTIYRKPILFGYYLLGRKKFTDFKSGF